MSRHLLLAIAVGVAGLATIVPAVAQDQGQGQNQGGGGGGGGGQGGGGGGGGGRQGFSPERMMERIKEEMKAPDDEWKVIQPKLEKVMTAQRNARGGFGGRGRGGGGGGGGGGQEDNSPVAAASRELRAVLQAEGSTEEQIAAKLTAYREARTKAETELKAARDSLKEVLSPRQEAVLVMLGQLE